MTKTELQSRVDQVARLVAGITQELRDAASMADTEEVATSADITAAADAMDQAVQSVTVIVAALQLSPPVKEPPIAALAIQVTP